MKDKDEGNTRNAYDVLWYYPQLMVTNSLGDVNVRGTPQTLPQILGNAEHLRASRELSVRWKSVDKKTNPYIIPTKSSHRICPVDVTSNSSHALVHHVIAGIGKNRMV
jgi:hypothetical protein